MIYIETGSTDVYYNFGLEYYFAAEKKLPEPVLLFWRTTPTLMVGKYQNILEEINKHYADAHKIRLVRRMSGGGTVYHDLGNLNYTLITGQSGALDYDRCLAPVLRALNALGVPAQKSLINFGAYVALFPQLIAGPIVRYADIARELEHREHSWENAAVGLRRFLVGLGKKVILADNFALLIRLFRQSGEKSVLFYWMYAVAFTLNIYFDFSGYSDMAIGLGRVLGFHFVENFNYPYLSRSVTEFWRRWHISLGSWFRDYVYIPMGGSRVSRWRWVLNILTVWMLTGLWHGAAWNFVLWGLLFAALLLAEKWIPVLQRLPGVLRHGYVLLAVVLSFVLFNADSLAQAGQDFAGLFGFGSLSLTSAETLYYLKSYAVLFVLGILGSTPVVKNAARRIDGTKAGVVLEAAAMLALLIVCTAYLVDGSFSPFLYFRF